MLNRTPLWKVILIYSALAVGVLFFLPNLYGEDPALQVTGSPRSEVTEQTLEKAKVLLQQHQLSFLRAEQNDKSLLIRFADESTQIAAKGVLQEALGEDYTVALNLAPATPQWMQDLGLSPMKLGLDLRGGVHFLMEVDMATALSQRAEQAVEDLRTRLREAKIRYSSVTAQKSGEVLVAFRDAENLKNAQSILARDFKDFLWEEVDASTVRGKFSEALLKEVRDYAVSQNTVILRNRTNELGVADAVVQRQGAERIVVELPGVQDTAVAKRILGATASVEFHGVDYEHIAADQSAIPPDSKIYYWRDGGPEVLKKRVVISGEHITGAMTGVDEYGRPTVNIALDSVGGRKFSDFTGQYLKKPMAVVFVEQKANKKIENVINVATIQEKLGQRFRIEGLDSPAEARELSLLLRAGSLAAPIQIIEERTIGPSSGQDNINKGMLSAVIGFMLVVLFITAYYKVFGFIANIALFLNMVLVVALMSMIPGATLTLPGIAGMVLTMGMAIDANVIIFERIKDELQRGNSAQTSIHAGFERAFSSIADSNITTVLAAIVLFAVGTGPVKGFALTLTLGIITSMFTAIWVARALINFVYGGKRIEKLSV